MRFFCLTSAFLVASALACSSKSTATAPDGGGPDVAAGTPTGGAGAPPDVQRCSGSTSACLFGTAEALPGGAGAAGFVVAPTHFKARLFRQFPSSGISALAEQLVAKDHTWA